MQCFCFTLLNLYCFQLYDRMSQDEIQFAEAEKI